VFDVAGRQVQSRMLQRMGAGWHVVALDQTTHLSPGVYVVRLTDSGRSLTKRGVVVRWFEGPECNEAEASRGWNWDLAERRGGGQD